MCCAAYLQESFFSLGALEGVLAHGSPVESMRYVSITVTGLTKLGLHVGPSMGYYPPPGYLSMARICPSKQNCHYELRYFL